MTMLQIKTPISGDLLLELQCLVNSITEIKEENGGKFRRYILLINSNNACKKYIIIYDQREEKAYKLFWKLKPETDTSKYVKQNRNAELEEEVYKKSVVDTVNLNSSSINELKSRLDKVVIDSYVYRLLENNAEIYTIHRIIGWQQLYSKYLYRGFKEISSLSGNYSVDNQKLYNEYNILKKYLESTDEQFTLPIFSYMLFSVNKSLFNFNYKKKFAMNIKCDPTNTDVIKLISRLNMNFMRIPMDQQNIFPTDIKKEFVIPARFCGPAYLKNSKFKLKDFSVFLYNSDSGKDKNKSVNKISNKVLQKDLNSQISYIFLNLINNEDSFIKITSPNKFQIEFLNDSLSSWYDLEKWCSFQKLVKDYMRYISNILSKEVKEQNDIYKSEIIKKIYQEFTEDDKIKIADYCIRNFVDRCLYYEDAKNLSEDYFQLFEKMLLSFNYKKFESIIDLSMPNDLSYKKLISECVEKIKSDIANYNLKKLSYKKIKVYTELMKDIAVDRYYDVLINEYIYTQNYKPQYFNNLYSKAEKELKKSLSGKKYDRVQVSRCSFLLAAMISFKDYIDDCLPEAAEDFNQYFQTFNNTILQICCEISNKSIDNSTALSEFSAFLKTQIDNNTIIDATSGTDSQIGWIDRKKNKIYLKNTSGNNFYDGFQKYLIKHGERIEISKQAFVRDILEEKSIITARYAGGSKRYDSERKIGEKKYRVLVLDCDLLGIH